MNIVIFAITKPIVRLLYFIRTARVLPLVNLKRYQGDCYIDYKMMVAIPHPAPLPRGRKAFTRYEWRVIMYNRFLADEIRRDWMAAKLDRQENRAKMEQIRLMLMEK